MISKEIVSLADFIEEADARSHDFGKTDKYKTGIETLDEYLGQGFGAKRGYEIITVFGSTGVGKSGFMLNMIAKEAIIGTKIGLMVLEDDMPDVDLRLYNIVGREVVARMSNVESLPPHDMGNPWRLEDLLEWMEMKSKERDIKLFVIDHIQFAFENEEAIKGDNEIVRQRRFLQQLNFLCKRENLTVIIVSHINKSDAWGMDKIMGTSAIQQVSTKVLEFAWVEGDHISVKVWKNRFVKRSDTEILYLKREGFRLQDAEIGFYPHVDENVKKGKKKK